MKTTVAMGLVLASLACGQEEPSTLTIPGLSGMLTETERAELALDADTLDMSGARFARALDRDAREWVLERASVEVRVTVDDGLKLDVRTEREDCLGQMSADGRDLVWSLARDPVQVRALETFSAEVPSQPSFVARDSAVSAEGTLLCEQSPRAFVLGLRHGPAISGGAF